VVQTVLNAFPVQEIRKKLIFTAGILALYRLGAYIPSPGVNAQAIQDGRQRRRGLEHPRLPESLLGRQPLEALPVCAGIMPYITASIILQLLTVVVPSLERLQKEGEVGQQKITQYTRYLTVVLAFAQSLGFVFLFTSGGSNIIGERTFPKVFLIRGHADRRLPVLMWRES